jgi:hypothetical protein
MLQAVTVPVVRSVVLGGLVLGLAAFAGRTTHHPVTHHLVLNAPVEAHAIYLTAFDHDEVLAAFDSSEPTPLVFEMRVAMPDGCRWLGVETLVPIDDHRFTYDYSETILDCDCGATPFRKTPRTGIVTVAD